MIDQKKADYLPSRIPKESISLEFVRSRGPGGQNVNKVATGSILRLKVRKTLLTLDEQERLLRLSGSKATNAGEIIIKADKHRSQLRNRDEAFDRLRVLVAKAILRPKHRVPRKLKLSQKKQRLDEKKRRSKLKENRTRPAYD